MYEKEDDLFAGLRDYLAVSRVLCVAIPEEAEQDVLGVEIPVDLEPLKPDLVISETAPPAEAARSLRKLLWERGVVQSEN
jgi:hypothetical protein